MTKKNAKPPREPDDAELWAHVMDSVKPLPARKRKSRHVPQAELPAASPPEPPVRSAPAFVPPPLPPKAPPAPPPLAVGASAGVDKSTAERFRKGQMPIEARVDLHRHTQLEAHRALESFLMGAQARGLRCVLVITGIGRSSGGVLREMVPRWLNEAPLRSRVLAIASAQPKDGADGAYYVLLKRQR